jgi:hypothetical protein
MVEPPGVASVEPVEDPFAVLGLASTATLEEVRAARRRLAKELHPDRGGDARRMGDVNRAFDLAVRSLLRPASASTAPAATRPPDAAPPDASPASTRPPDAAPAGTSRSSGRPGSPVEHDAPSFSVDVLPAEAFEALLVVSGWDGEVLVDDPPYLLEVYLYAPFDCWCRFELVPEAGATTVSITVAGYDGRRPPPVEVVRDHVVSQLNTLGWRDD